MYSDLGIAVALNLDLVQKKYGIATSCNQTLHSGINYVVGYHRENLVSEKRT